MHVLLLLNRMGKTTIGVAHMLSMYLFFMCLKMHMSLMSFMNNASTAHYP
jgi:hypothetical protein